MTTRSGFPVSITKAREDGGHEKLDYVVLVDVPDDATWEVGLCALRRCLAVKRFTAQQAQILAASKPATITFTGRYHDSLYGPINKLTISKQSAQEWAGLVNGLLFTTKEN